MAVHNGVTSIGDRVRRLSHVVINVTDLERSIAFYESVSSLRVVSRYSAPRQNFAPLALEVDQGRYDAAVLDDQTGGDPVAIHLVQWREPDTVGQAYSSFLDHGMVKIGIAYPDPEAKERQLADAAVEPVRPVVRNYFTVADPDGALVSFLNFPGTRTERLFHTCLAMVAGVEETIAFYRDVIGLDYWMNSAVPGPVAASQGPGSSVAHFDSHFFRGRGDRRFSLDCSKSHLEHDAEPRHELANHVGISRFALEVDDLAACAQTLPVAAGPSAPGLLDPTPVRWDLGELGTRSVLLVRDPSGHVFELFEPTKWPFIDRRPGAA